MRDGLRAIKNAIDDQVLIPGAGAFEVAASRALHAYKEEVKGKQRLGVQAFADALLVIPKNLGNEYSNLYFNPFYPKSKIEHFRTQKIVKKKTSYFEM